mmetsp:Transcript_8676/g.9895  ORF Transcript_8676/g.9895 Transcript_8676/m.9895 type:complete len:538 (+) Transcript_8676:201-1814(+)|eukprot:CAMPEP_0184009378 /NCGR_PEP_ID=MMETSP0954-20121128/2556_1 /TAXON_ID=627963 /ORGANISM="Aplanochytrium sp, Strain PBS07" /LENGTH=537 /DNA_ID=CAMNT_0026288713 /DNA_START=182 /DNA_END=1795 /DNA_ORIENTATION=+
MTTKVQALKKVAAAFALLILGRRIDKSFFTKPYATASVLGFLLYCIKAPGSLKGVKSLKKRLPLLGHVVAYEEIREHPVEGIYEWSKFHNFETFNTQMPFGLREIFLHDERDRKHILRSNFQNYKKNYSFMIGFKQIFHDLLGEGIFNVDSQEWVTHRKIASNLFTGKNIGVLMSEIFVSHGQNMVKSLSKLADEKKSFDIQLLFQSLVFDAFSEIAFGHTPQSFDNAIEGRKESFQTSFDMAQQFASDRSFELPPIRDLKIYFKLGQEKELARHLTNVNKRIYDIIDSRQDEIAEKELNPESKKDILGLYIYHAKKQGRTDLLSKAYLRDVVMNFMIAGRDTTSNVLTNVISLVSENPDFEEKLVKEIAAKMAGGMENFIQNEIKDFPLADATFFEALRMYPSVSNDFRIAQEDDVLPSGTTVESGTLCTIPIHSIGRDPKHWDEPNQFRPERWLYQDPEKGTMCRRLDEFKFPFFWGGYRACLGKDMARHEAKIIMCLLLHSLKFKLTQPRKEKFVNGPVMFYAEGMHMSVERRR